MATPSSDFEATPERRKQFLVLIDSHPEDLFETGMLLQRFEYNVFTAGTAEEALQYMSVAVPAALITDLLLRGMSGLDLINRIKQEDRTKDVPVIVQTAMKDPKVEELCKLAGCAAFLRKPVDHNTLYRALQAALEATPRSYIRLNICLRAEIAPVEGRAAAAGDEWVTALSENGLFIRTRHPSPVNAQLSVTFPLDGRFVTARAIVLYAFSHAAGPMKEPGMGMKFSDLSSRDRQLIQEFIKDELMRDVVSRVRHKWQHTEEP